MSETETTQIALRVSRSRNRELLADLLASHDIVDITDSVPDNTDLCLVDAEGFSGVEDMIAGWKRHQRPLFAPVILLSESSGPDPWKKYVDVIGGRVDAIQPIPAPKAAIRTRIESLLKTRQYSRGLTSERQLVERIFETTPIAQAVLDTDGAIVRANQRAEELFGLSESELSGRTYDSTEWEIIDEDGDPIPSEELPFARVMDSGKPIYGYEHGIKRSSGETAWLSINIGPLRNENGEIEYLVSAIDDITGLREKERQLRRTQQAIEASDHAVYITDTDGRIEYANPAFERITGFDQETVIGETPNILNSGEMSDDYYDELWATIQSGNTWHEEITNQRKGGNPYHAVQTIDPIIGKSGEIEGFVAIQTDISEHKDRLQQLQVMDRVLRHNLHNDMNVVRGYAEIIGEEGSDPLATYAEQIVEYSDHLLELTGNQRKITEVLTTEPNIASRDVVSLTHAAIDRLSAEYPDARIHLDMPDRATVSATDGLGDAIEELIENAIMHTDQESPEVRIMVREDTETIQMRIIDSGPGIPEMERQVVTGDHEIEPLYHGTGLGLWLVSWIIRRSNGRLSFEENTPRGTVVVITLQRASAAGTGATSQSGGDGDGE